MAELHVTYPSDDGPDDDGTTPQLHILRDDQGDYYISISTTAKVGWTSVRLCGPSGGGAATKSPEFYDAVAMAARALAGDRDGVLALAREILHAELGQLRRELGRERSAKERAELELANARKTIRQNYRRHVEQREALVGGDHAWCPVCEAVVGPITPEARARGVRCGAGHELVYSTDWKAKAEQLERELSQLKADAAQLDPYDPEHPDYQRYYDSCAKDCRCDGIVCPGVLAGGLCDSWDGSPGGFDDHADDGDADLDWADECEAYDGE